MQEMPEPFRIVEGIFFDHRSFGFEIGDHFIDGDIIISNGGRFTVAPDAEMFQLHHECGLVCFCSARCGERVTERQVVFEITNVQEKELK